MVSNNYSEENLSAEDKKMIAIYDFAIEDATNREYIIEDMLGLHGDESLTAEITREIAKKTLDSVEEYMQWQRRAMVISWLDEMGENNEQAVAEKDKKKTESHDKSKTEKTGTGQCEER